MVRLLRFAGVIIAAALLGTSATHNLPVSLTSPSRQNARIVAWVDFDFEAARQGVARFRTVLRAQRFDDPRPVALEFVGVDVANPEQLTFDMTRLSATRPALIVASSVTVARSLLELHTNIPVYFIIQSDPRREGLVRSLVSTGSLTGYTFFVPLDVKVMELVRRIFPAYSTIGVLADPVWLGGTSVDPDLFSQAKALGLDLQIYELHGVNDLQRTLQEARNRKVQLWYVPYTEMAFDHGAEIASALAQTPTPTVYARRKFLNMGGLLSVQSVDEDAMKIWAKSIANILNGVSPGSIPVMRPKEIEIAVNSEVLSHLDRTTRDRIAREATLFE